MQRLPCPGSSRQHGRGPGQSQQPHCLMLPPHMTRQPAPCGPLLKKGPPRRAGRTHTPKRTANQCGKYPYTQVNWGHGPKSTTDKHLTPSPQRALPRYFATTSHSQRQCGTASSTMTERAQTGKNRQKQAQPGHGKQGARKGRQVLQAAGCGPRWRRGRTAQAHIARWVR